MSILYYQQHIQFIPTAEIPVGQINQKTEKASIWHLACSLLSFLAARQTCVSMCLGMLHSWLLLPLKISNNLLDTIQDHCD